MEETKAGPRPGPPGRPRITSCRGVRGATTLEETLGEDAMVSAVGEMLERILADNRADREDIAAVIFTVPEELAGTNPAAAARARGFEAVPLLVVREHGGDRRVERCLRVLVLLNTELSQRQLRHAYLRGAQALRPDLVAAEAEPK